MFLETVTINGFSVFILVSQIESLRDENNTSVVITKSGETYKVHMTPTEVLKLWKDYLCGVFKV